MFLHIKQVSVTYTHKKFVHYVGNKYEFLLFYCNCSKALGLAIQNFSVSLPQSNTVKIYMANNYFNCTDTAKEHLCVQKYHSNITGELNFCPNETYTHYLTAIFSFNISVKHT